MITTAKASPEGWTLKGVIYAAIMLVAVVVILAGVAFIVDAYFAKRVPGPFFEVGKTLGVGQGRYTVVERYEVRWRSAMVGKDRKPFDGANEGAHPSATAHVYRHINMKKVCYVKLIGKGGVEYPCFEFANFSPDEKDFWDATTPVDPR